ncbi:NAD(P)H-dependent oxidoreductase [Streptomyces sp. 150FB]|uniref:NADPH-dependent FMN reductase n=1 Tax=Streptomyces sp. 150FB TaxID=1576605 RepID=UPI000A8B5B27|nr:NAD(P)H-dependent oxidoreductase [Streptomyces sp. 150FB]
MSLAAEQATSTAVLKVAIIVGTTRPGRKADAVAQWVKGIAEARTDAAFEVVDIADYALPHMDEPVPPRGAQGYSQPHTRAWAEKIGSFDAYVFVTPEYNGSFPGVLKDAVDFLFTEWSGKAAGFVGYGFGGGARSVAHLRQVLTSVEITGVPSAVELNFNGDFEEMTRFTPRDSQEKSVVVMLDELVAKGAELKG